MYLPVLSRSSLSIWSSIFDFIGRFGLSFVALPAASTTIFAVLLKTLLSERFLPNTPRTNPSSEYNLSHAMLKANSAPNFFASWTCLLGRLLFRDLVNTLALRQLDVRAQGLHTLCQCAR